MPLVFANLTHLFEAEALEILNTLWNSGKFKGVLEAVETIEWEDLMHGMIIYSMAKIMSLNREQIIQVFDISPEDYTALEIRLITDKINAPK